MSDIARVKTNELDSIKAVDGMAKLLVQDRDGRMGFPATSKAVAGRGSIFFISIFCSRKQLCRQALPRCG